MCIGRRNRLCRVCTYALRIKEVALGSGLPFCRRARKHKREDTEICLRDVGTRTFERIEEALNKWNLALDDGLIEDVEGWDEYVQYAVNKMSGQPCNNQ